MSEVVQTRRERETSAGRQTTATSEDEADEDNSAKIARLRTEQNKIAINAATKAGEIGEGTGKKSKKTKKKKKRKKKQKSRRRGGAAASSDGDTTDFDEDGDEALQAVPEHLRGRFIYQSALRSVITNDKKLPDDAKATILAAALGDFGKGTSIQSASARDTSDTDAHVDDKASQLSSQADNSLVDFRIFRLAMQLVAFIKSGRKLDMYRNPDGQFSPECMLRDVMNEINLPEMDVRI